MGSAEFEWGAIPQSFKRIRAREDLKDWKIVPIDHEGRVCYYVGPADQLGNATMWFQRELTEQGKTEMKDPSRLYESYTSDNHWDLERIGWWPVFEDRNAYYQKVDYAWAVFKTKEHADYWLRSLQEP